MTKSVAERLRNAIQEHLFAPADSDFETPKPNDGPVRPLRITATIGAMTCARGHYPRTRKLLLERLDQALYRAKAEGRNCVTSFVNHDQLELGSPKGSERVTPALLGRAPAKKS